MSKIKDSIEATALAWKSFSIKAVSRRLYIPRSPDFALVKIVDERDKLLAEVTIYSLRASIAEIDNPFYGEALQLLSMGQYEIVFEETLQSKLRPDRCDVLFVIEEAYKFLVRVEREIRL